MKNNLEIIYRLVCVLLVHVRAVQHVCVVGVSRLYILHLVLAASVMSHVLFCFCWFTQMRTCTHSHSIPSHTVFLVLSHSPLAPPPPHPTPHAPSTHTPHSIQTYINGQSKVDEVGPTWKTSRLVCSHGLWEGTLTYVQSLDLWWTSSGITVNLNPGWLEIQIITPTAGLLWESDVLAVYKCRWLDVHCSPSHQAGTSEVSVCVAHLDVAQAGNHRFNKH